MTIVVTPGSGEEQVENDFGMDPRSARLEEVCTMLGRVVHDVNNPLAIISGNAQLLVEISRGMGLDQDLAKPLGDIEEAAQMLAERLARLSKLREEVERSLGEATERS